MASVCRRVVVTGATGFIGSHLVRRLIQRGMEVYAVSRNRRERTPSGVRWWHGNLSEFAQVRDLFTSIRPDLIFHLASHVSGSRSRHSVLPTFRDNLMTTVNLLTAAEEIGCRRIVMTGSLEEPHARTDATPCSPYAAAKWSSSAYAKMFHALYNLPVVMLRLFMTYGPGQQDLKKLVPYVTCSLLRGESPQLTSGERQIDWIYVDDVVEALLKAGDAEGIDGETIDIGSGELRPVRTIVERLVHLIDTLHRSWGSWPTGHLNKFAWLTKHTPSQRSGGNRRLL